MQSEETEMKVWVSSRASRLNAQDKIDFDFMAEMSKINGGDAYQFIYHAHYDGTNVYITTDSEDGKM